MEKIRNNINSLEKNIKDQALKLYQDGLYFAPIRHHSPGCSYALKSLIEEVQPKTILIEAPADCEHLINACLDEETYPPVAFFTQKGSGESMHSAYFPMCEYSPEWQAIKLSKITDATVKFIDLPYADRDISKLDKKVQNLMDERYLQHSKYLSQIAKIKGCRDHHESWDQMFEQRPIEDLKNWRTYFKDVYSYCAMARMDYEPEVLFSSGDSTREAHMLSCIYDDNVQKPAVIITGGFHTPALIADEKKITRQHKKIETTDKQWIIRYSFDQLDSLNGYSAGMQSPFYYQLTWDYLIQNSSNYLEYAAAKALTAVAQDNRAQKITRFISSSEVQASIAMSNGLSSLRGTHGPGRSDIYDAIKSCYIKDSLDLSLSTITDARRVLCGDTLGNIPASVQNPPLVSEAREVGIELGLKFDETQKKTLSLDIYKNPKHKKISRYFHLMRWIGSGLCVWKGGPDFVSGSQTSLVKEHWEYSWSPNVEGNLISLLTEGSTLEDVAVNKLKNAEKDFGKGGLRQSSLIVSQILIRACIMGLHYHVVPLAKDLIIEIQHDDNISSLAKTGQQVISLDKGRAILDSDKLNVDLQYILNEIWTNLLYLIPSLAELNEDSALENLDSLILLDNFSKEVNNNQRYYEELSILVDNKNCSSTIRGAALGLLFIGGELSTNSVILQLDKFLQDQQSTQAIIGFMRGLIKIAKTLLWRVPDIIQHINNIIEKMPEEKFLSLLPALRHLFTELSPREINLVAERIVGITNVDINLLHQKISDFSSEEMIVFNKLESLSSESIKKTSLMGWLDESE